MSLIPYLTPNKKIKKKKKRKAAYKKAVRRARSAVTVANLGGYGKTGGLARWGKYTWRVTADQIRTLATAEFSDEWDADGKKREPAEAKLSYPVHKDLQPYVNIASEIRQWRSLIGKAAYLYVGGTQFGTTKKYRLTGVDVQDVAQVGGRIVGCSIDLTFTEVKDSKSTKVPKRVKKKTTKKTTKGKKKQPKKKK
ncbi:MAG: hypothetical protein IJ087_03060 [Eggerthellaceae bacterium]|nr:hypothetical protein [Eggerthellaceae bacterium]